MTTCGDDAPAGGSPSGLRVSVGTHGVRPGGCPPRGRLEYADTAPRSRRGRDWSEHERSE
ncbi:MAG: hypothetical protein IKN98_09570 [Bacteroidales bacterium]|nr:hypothetical protein [Bacteroidales bacterium]